jgi:hypothetical protein
MHIGGADGRQHLVAVANGDMLRTNYLTRRPPPLRLHATLQMLQPQSLNDTVAALKLELLTCALMPSCPMRIFGRAAVDRNYLESCRSGHGK